MEDLDHSFLFVALFLISVSSTLVVCVLPSLLLRFYFFRRTWKQIPKVRPESKPVHKADPPAGRPPSLHVEQQAAPEAAESPEVKLEVQPSSEECAREGQGAVAAAAEVGLRKAAAAETAPDISADNDCIPQAAASGVSAWLSQSSVGENPNARDIGVRVMPDKAEDAVFAHGTRVQVVNLVEKPANNGRCGEVVRYNVKEGKYVIRPDGGSKDVMLKPENVALASPAEPAAAEAEAEVAEPAAAEAPAPEADTEVLAQVDAVDPPQSTVPSRASQAKIDLLASQAKVEQSGVEPSGDARARALKKSRSQPERQAWMREGNREEPRPTLARLRSVGSMIIQDEEEEGC